MLMISRMTKSKEKYFSRKGIEAVKIITNTSVASRFPGEQTNDTQVSLFRADGKVERHHGIM